MEINFVCEKLSIRGGGSNVSLDALARGLVERGHTVQLITIDRELNELPAERPYSVAEYAVDRSAHAIHWNRDVARIMAHHDDCDVFHVFTPILLPAAGLYRKDGETPVVGRLNSYAVFCTNQSAMTPDCYERCTSFRKFLHDDADGLRKLLKSPVYVGRTKVLPRLVDHVDKLFAQSPAVKDVYETVGFEVETSVVPNFYDPDFASPDGSSGDIDEFDERTFDVLSVARLEQYKGLRTLFDAIAGLDFPVHAHVVGDGPDREPLKSYARSLGVNARVTFHGWVSHSKLPHYYRNSDVLVHPAIWPEPFGRAVLESMQCGTPVIVSDVGGPPWVAKDAGLTFDPGNSVGLRSMLVTLYDNPEMIDLLRDRCKTQIERFEPERVVQQILHEYHTVS